MNKAANIFIIGLCLILSIGSCSKDDPNVDPDGGGSGTEVLPVSENNKVIYEVNLRNFSAKGNFSGLQNDLPRLKELGIDVLWLMPIHPIGEKNRTGSKGSPYSVKDYMAINPDYGNAAELKSLISAAHAADMEVWLDWVANHTAWDHPWVTEHLDYYAEKDGVRPYSPFNWTDVAQLDFSNNNMRTAMIDAMKYWVKEFGIDGYRCDYATGIPTDFWDKAKLEVNAIKKITWLCEGDNANYMKAFDYDYAWSFNTALNDFGKNGNIVQLVSECKKLFNNSAYSERGRMVYLTNHDLNAYEGTEFTRYGNYIIPLTVLYFTIYDMPLIYNGQEIGYNKTMGLFDVNTIQWSPINATISNLFKKLIQLKRSQLALESGKNRGSLNFYKTTSDNLMVYSRKRGNNEVLVILNFSNASVNWTFSETAPTGEFKNYFLTEKKSFDTQTNMTIPAYGYTVYVK